MNNTISDQRWPIFASRPTVRAARMPRCSGLFKTCRARRFGFTLAEAAVSILIVSIMLVAALNMVATSVRARQINARLAKGSALAHELMNEIVQARYEDPNPVSTPVEGAEELLYSYDATNNVQNLTITSSNNVGQYFRPALAENALSWSISRVKLSLRSSGATTGSTDLQIFLPTAADLPSGSLLQQVSIPENLLSDGYRWEEFSFNAVKNLDPCEGVCVVLDWAAGAESCRVRNGLNVSLPNIGGLSHDGDFDWAIDRDDSLLMYVYGKVTITPPFTATVGRDLYEANSPRAGFDDVDDYDGWACSPPLHRDGTKMAAYAGWTQAVAVVYVSPTDPMGAAVRDDLGMKRITVTITDERGEETVLVGLRTNEGAYEAYAGYTKTYVSWLGVDLRVGKATAPIRLGAAMVNEPVIK